jgi:cytochrome c oxidase subunit 4
MAHNDSAPQGGHTTKDAHGAAGGHAAAHDAHAHPTWKQYKWVALILTLITVVEVWIYYIPSFVATKLFVPSLLIMSAVKFAIVVLFYMHLKYDARLFRALFTGPLIIAVLTLISLLFLFGHLAVRLGS